MNRIPAIVLVFPTLAAVVASQVPVLQVPAQFATIQAAIQAAPSPARVEVAPGTYQEVIDFLGKNLEVVGIAGPANTTIDGFGSNDACVTADSNEPPTARIRGFRLTRGAGKPFPSSYGFDYYGGGVYVGGDGSGLQIENCWIVDNATSTGTFGGGICVAGGNAHAEVRSCLIARNRAWASGGATLVTGTNSTMLLERCTIVANTATAWAFGHQGGVSMANGGGVTLRDSIIWGNAGYQIRAFGAPYNAGTWAIATYCCVQNGFLGAGNIAANPLFRGESTGDYRLTPASPCVDAGDPTSAPDPDNSRADMGCFPLNGIPPAAFLPFGQGCSGTAGVPILGNHNNSLPRLGTSFTMRMSNLPNGPLFVPLGFLGYSNTTAYGVPLPLSMGIYGMPPQCLQFVDPTDGIFYTLINAGGIADWTVPIPNNPLLIGGAVYVQAIVLDWSLPFAFPAVATNAAEMVVGY